MTKRSYELILLLLAVVSLVVLVNNTSTTLSFRYPAKGTIDFLQYWSAFQLFTQGVNPYDSSALHEIQVRVGQAADQTIIMWNPPWTLLLLSPFLIMSFSSAALSWFIFNLGATAAIVVLSTQSHYSFRGKLLPTALAAALFYPIWQTIVFGQLGILLTLSAAVFLWSLARERDFLAGIALLAFSAKPHLLLVFGLAVLWWVAREKRFRIIWGLLSSFALLCSLTYLLSPDAIADWYSAIRSTPQGPGAVSIPHWRSASPAHFLRALLPHSAISPPPVWPMWALLTLGLGTTALYLLSRPQITWPIAAAPLLCLSLTTAPYSWVFDQSLLLIPQLLLILWTLSGETKHKKLLLGLLISFQGAYLLTALQPQSAQHHFAWGPPFQLIITIAVLSLVNRIEEKL